MPNQHVVHIHRKPGETTTFHVDGLDIANAATGLDIHMRGPGIPEITVRMLPGELELDSEAAVRVDERTYAALLVLGWTPPTEKTIS